MGNSQQEDRWQTWYEQFDEHHSPEIRRQWYSNAAKAYRWARPKYPETLIDRVTAQARLISQLTARSSTAVTEPSSILEIGCGPGIATAALATRGFRVQAVEPSAVACELARESCKAYEQVSIYNGTFEDYPLTKQRFDAVLAATSFHWVSPAVACQKSAAALNPGGSLILLWATPPQLSEEICEHLQSVYDRFDLSELGLKQQRTQAYYQHNFETFAQTIADSGLFQRTAVEVERQTSLYSGDKYLALLSTLSDYIALETHRRNELFDALGKSLAEWLVSADRDDALELTHWFAAQVAPLAV